MDIKHARDMTDAAYRAARAAIVRPGRPVPAASAPPPPAPAAGAQTGTTSSTATPPPAMAPTGQGRHARDMSDKEYAALKAQVTRPRRFAGMGRDNSS
jgi:hypothetical protein